MKTIQWIMAGLAVGLSAGATGELIRNRRLASALSGPQPDGPEPILGYDGMDQETCLEWLRDADLDPTIVHRVILYENANRRREPIITALQELLG